MKKFIKKYISLILIFVSSFMILPISAMKTAKTQVEILSYEQLIVQDSQRLSRPSSLPSIPKQPNIAQNNLMLERRYGTQRNKLIKECLYEFIAAIKSLFQRQSNINALITA